MADLFPQTSSHFVISGPAGNLELMTTWPSELQHEYVAVICHPHPLFQGSMKNKVVTTLFRAFDRLGVPTVRFNFRGVGQSQGQHGEGVGEQDDLMAVIRWLTDVLPGFEVSLSGFSFGSYIAAAVANREPVSGLITIAPPVHHYAFNKLTQVRCPWLVVMGDQDEIVPFADVNAFVENSPLPMDYQVMPAATHFFHGRLIDLREDVVRWLQSS